MNKLKCSRQAYVGGPFSFGKAVCLQLAMNTLAWDNRTGLQSTTVVLGVYSLKIMPRLAVMINRDSRGHSYLIVRGEILGSIKDELKRKHLSRMFSLIKNES